MNDTVFRIGCSVVLTSVVAYKLHTRKLSSIESIHSKQMIEEYMRGWRKGFNEGMDNGRLYPNIKPLTDSE